jgi:hypothetical protein
LYKKRIFEVFGLGQCCLDYIGKIFSYPPLDTKCEFSDAACKIAKVAGVHVVVDAGSLREGMLELARLKITRGG